MSRNLGLLLRLIGPLIEILALMTYLEYRGRGVRFLGASVEMLCFIAIGLGLCFVLVGLALSNRRPRKRPPSFRLDLGSEGDEEV